MPPDLAALLRRYKPERHRETLRPGPPPSRAAPPRGRPPALLLDTTAIIDDLTGRLPPETADLLDRSIQFHCSVCLAELAVGLAKRDPAAAETALFRDKLQRLMERIPDHRLLTPDADTWAAAGILAGTLARTQRYQREQGRKMLNDALVFLVAARRGIPVLTENRKDHDLLRQVAGHGGYVHYTAL